ncbi:streptomycin 3'-adenylyltransferase [Prauserella sediminis]|uniref:Streptomycin 3'-adenylyltransferase n=1 Tax=Prauserella sediminis TaxID=577680 RepID=A0A839XFD9_9PSEU|nr:aminoglycoside adenylyltransferase domain-containing protein [Prauserella sediminis]MBB3662672.1 streptomycin 3'-adenylyltransferase [Prauserella sediminis]
MTGKGRATADEGLALRVAELLDGVVGDDVIGCYLHGSAVLGGMRPASDLDVLAVTRRSLDDERRRELTRGLLGMSGIGGGLRPVELMVAVRRDVARDSPAQHDAAEHGTAEHGTAEHEAAEDEAGEKEAAQSGADDGGVTRSGSDRRDTASRQFPPVVDYLYGEWLREWYEAGYVPGPEPMPDLVLAVASALAGDRTLVGPPPAEVLAPVPHADVIRASLAGLDEALSGVDTDTRNVVLTVARVWATVETGEIVPKDEAAAWAAQRLPEEYRAVTEHARELYLGSEYADEVWPAQVLARVHGCVERMAAAARAGSGTTQDT